MLNQKTRARGLSVQRLVYAKEISTCAEQVGVAEAVSRIVPLLKAAGLADRQPTGDHDPLLRRRAESWTRDTFLVEYTGLSQCVDGHRCNDAANNTYRGLRIVNSTTNLAYVQYTEAADWNYQTPYWTELYDLSQDPYQLENIVSTTRGKAIASELQPRLEVAWRCAGPSCKDV